MGEELSKEISDPQSHRPTQSLGCDRPGFTTLVTRARSYSLPDPMTKQTRVKQGFINPERLEIQGQRSPASSPNHGGARQESHRISPLSNFYADSNLDHEVASCSYKNDNYSTGPRSQFSRPILNPTEISFASMPSDITSSPSYDIFRKRLKTHFFIVAFG